MAKIWKSKKIGRRDILYPTEIGYQKILWDTTITTRGSYLIIVHCSARGSFLIQSVFKIIPLMFAWKCSYIHPSLALLYPHLNKLIWLKRTCSQNWWKIKNARKLFSNEWSLCPQHFGSLSVNHQTSPKTNFYTNSNLLGWNPNY